MRAWLAPSRPTCNGSWAKPRLWSRQTGRPSLAWPTPCWHAGCCPGRRWRPFLRLSPAPAGAGWQLQGGASSGSGNVVDPLRPKQAIMRHRECPVVRGFMTHLPNSKIQRTLNLRFDLPAPHRSRRVVAPLRGRCGVWPASADGHPRVRRPSAGAGPHLPRVVRTPSAPGRPPRAPAQTGSKATAQKHRRTYRTGQPRAASGRHCAPDLCSPSPTHCP
jgi:hypothetical protein